jgi:hypothetical protein
MIDGIGNEVTHDGRVNEYRDEGMSRKEAERNVFEDDFFDDMNNHR